MSDKAPSRVLYVEGKGDIFAVAELMEQNGVAWPRKKPPVDIREAGGDVNLLELLSSADFKTILKASELKSVGVMLDADTDAQAVWRRVQPKCREFATSFPDQMSPGGTICKTDDGLDFGVWIMPDNQSRGMLETFLTFLVPDQANDCWRFARQCAAEAKSHGAPYRDQYHADKAAIHTWLAWQDEPGPRLGEAIRDHVLDATSPHAAPFVKWFRDLFQV